MIRIEVFSKEEIVVKNNSDVSTPWFEPTSSGQPYPYKLSRASFKIIGKVALTLES